MVDVVVAGVGWICWLLIDWSSIADSILCYQTPTTLLVVFMIYPPTSIVPGWICWLLMDWLAITDLVFIVKHRLTESVFN